MSITAKELAKMLNLSEAAVSMALNGKPGVSTQTRNLILQTAQNYSYDFTKIKKNKTNEGSIDFLIFRKDGAVLKVQGTAFFNTLTSHLEQYCKNTGFKLRTHTIISGPDVAQQLNKLLSSDCVGIILLGTEMIKEDFFPFAYITKPIVVLDTFFNSAKMDCILMNNADGAYNATRFLIKKRQAQPGHLKSSYNMFNFESREDGFYKALRDSGLATSNSIVHSLSPSMEGAYADMVDILERGDEIATCYFADNDLIAAGAIKALKEFGYRIPEDIGIIGFDNISLCTYLEPNLTTVNVPIRYMVEVAVDRLISVIKAKEYQPVKIEVNTNLVIRKSV